MVANWFRGLANFILALFNPPKPAPAPSPREEPKDRPAGDSAAWTGRGISFKNDTASWNAGLQASAVAAFYAYYGNEAEVERALSRIISPGLALKLAKPIHKTEDAVVPNISTAGYDGLARCINLEYTPNDAYAKNVRQPTLDRLGNMLIHEVGHIICERLDHFSQRDPWVSAIKNTSEAPPSNYAPISPTEDFAESFAAWVNHTPGNSSLYQTAFSPMPGNPDNNPGLTRLRLVEQAVDNLK